LCNTASNDASNEQRTDSQSPVSSQLGFDDRERKNSPVMIFKDSRSKSLQTNSLGMTVNNSPRMITRAAALRLSPKRDSLNPSQICEEFNHELRNINISPTHGVKYKVHKPK
jgi:hypothetical protein